MVTPDGIRIKVPREKLPEKNIVKMEGNKLEGGNKKPILITKSVSIPEEHLEKLSKIQVKGNNPALQIPNANNRFSIFDIILKEGKVWVQKEKDGKKIWALLTTPEADQFSFIINLKGELKIGYGHYYLSESAKEVLAAGSVIFENGKVKLITNGSGHYLPSSQELNAVVEIFDKIGITTADRQIKSFNWKPKN